MASDKAREAEPGSVIQLNAKPGKSLWAARACRLSSRLQTGHLPTQDSQLCALFILLVGNQAKCASNMGGQSYQDLATQVRLAN
jgi:hypothetical protein